MQKITLLEESKFELKFKVEGLGTFIAKVQESGDVDIIDVLDIIKNFDEVKEEVNEEIYKFVNEWVNKYVYDDEDEEE
jgi:hypothetical protein